VIVYGDPQYTFSRGEARERLKAYYDYAVTNGIDGARDLVIALGQIEQGIADAHPQAATLTAIMQATDRAAEYFVSQNLGKACAPELLDGSWHLAFCALDGTGDLQIKIPEGFAFYSLFPEQYLTSAEIYSANRGVAKTLVVGIRSIGTTLSAIVKAALAARGFEAERISVRPKGHPFARETEIDHAPKSDAVIIVDEGPGLSGSSIASVVAAFRDRGATDITIFPGHPNPPGHAASDETKRIWAETPIIVKPCLHDPQTSLILKLLRRESENLLGAPVRETKDLSAGAWAGNSAELIHIAPPFERTKFLMHCENGRSLLWKFAGLGPGRVFENIVSTAVAHQNKLAAEHWCSPALVSRYGFIATEWLDAPHPACPPDDATCAQLADYIITASKPPLTESQIQTSITRLREMMPYNFRQAGLQNIASASEKLEPNIETLSKLPSSGDGRMAPHEFLILSGKLLKTDIWGHDSDHTIVGPQPILWDIAGTIIEWNMNPHSKLPTHFNRHVQIIPADLLFYLCAYSAFRMGMSSLASDPEGVAYYTERAESLLQSV
jgi:hypothetical protein